MVSVPTRRTGRAGAYTGISEGGVSKAAGSCGESGASCTCLLYTSDPGFLRLVILCVVVELNEILLQEWRERRYASIKQPTIIQANLFGKLEIISATDVLKDDSFTNESGYVLLTFLLLNRKREHPLRLLTDVIWESTDMENPYNSIKNVVYRLRNTLACIGIRDLIQASHGTFTLNPNYTIFTDVDRFGDACKRIDNSSDPAILQTLYESIIGLYRGSLLPRYDFYHWLMRCV